MKISRTGDGVFELTVSRDELRILSNAVNEALEALHDSELSIRMGASSEEIRAVRSAFREFREG